MHDYHSDSEHNVKNKGGEELEKVEIGKVDISVNECVAYEGSFPSRCTYEDLHFTRSILYLEWLLLLNRRKVSKEGRIKTLDKNKKTYVQRLDRPS